MVKTIPHGPGRIPAFLLLGGNEPLIEEELFAHSYQSGIVAKRSLQRQGFRVQKPGKCVDLLICSMCSPKSPFSLLYEIFADHTVYFRQDIVDPEYRIDNGLVCVLIGLVSDQERFS